MGWVGVGLLVCLDMDWMEEGKGYLRKRAIIPRIALMGEDIGYEAQFIVDDVLSEGS